MSEELDVLNQFIPNDEAGNKKYLENKDVDQESPEFLTKGGADFPYAEGPLGKQPLPAPKEKRQILPVYPGIVSDVNVPGTGVRGVDSGFFSQSEDEKAIVKNIAELKQQQQNKYSTRVMQAMEDAGFGDSKIDISDFTESSFLGVSPTEETETSKVLNSYPGSQQAQLAFVDDDDDYEQWLKTTVGEDNYKIFYDKKSGFLEPRAYVSIRKPDGEFTPFSSVTKTLTDGLLQFGSTIAYEIPAYAANVAQATAIAAPFARLPFIGIPLASTVFIYQLYAGGKGKERLREFVKEEMGINEDADKNLHENTVRFLENALDVAFSPGQGTFREELSGVADAIPGGAYFVRAFKNATDKMKNKFINLAGDSKNKFFPSVKPALDMAKATQPGGKLDVGVPLERLIITNVTPNKILERFQNISSQVSILIPTKIKEQLDSAMNYVTTYKDNLGKGNFKSFRESLDTLGTYLQNARGKMSDIEMKNVGTSYIELDAMFNIFRKFENDGMYAKVFDKLRNSQYDLSTIRAALPDVYKAIIPVRGKKGAIEADVAIAKQGEGLIRNAVEQLALLGNKDGKLTRQAVASAVKQFKKDYPDFRDIDYSKVKSPAELLQMYSSYFGHLGNNVFGDPAAKTFDRGLAKQANKFRNLFMDLIAKPDKKIPGVYEDLKKANDFYRDTIVKTSMETQVALRASGRGRMFQDPGNFIPKIIGSKTGSAPTEFSTITIQNIGFMQNYVDNFFAKVSPQDVKRLLKNARKSDVQIADGKYSLEKLKTAFNAIVGNKVNNITMTETGKVGTAQEVIDYLNAFDDAALEVFNLTKAIGKRTDGSTIYDTTAKQKLINDAINLQNLAQGDFINLKNLSVTTDFGLAMKQVFDKPVELQTNLEKIIKVTTRGTRAQNNAQRRNVRAGLLQYIFSTNSGVVKQLKENSAFGNAGDFRLDSGALQEIVEQINNTPGFKKIFNKKDFDVLNGINQYMLTINKGMNDVGASLSGAQVIGGILEGVTNLDTGKATSGLLRLAGQNRLARVFLSPVVTDMFTGASLKNIRTNKDKLKEIFLGKQSFAAVVTNIALDPSAGLYEQTDEMLSTPKTLSEEEKDVLKQFNLMN